MRCLNKKDEELAYFISSIPKPKREVKIIEQNALLRILAIKKRIREKREREEFQQYIIDEINSKFK